MPSLRATRRQFIQQAAAGAALTAAGIFAPHVAGAAARTRWLRAQSVWPAATVGYSLFEAWCDGIAERTGGELGFRPHPSGALVGDFQLFHGIRNGVVHVANVFPSYWAGPMPGAVFVGSFPMGLDRPSQWDRLYAESGAADAVRRMYNARGLEWLGWVHHDMDLIHSTRPVRSLADFRGLRLRAPGGLVADCFAAVGARPMLLPGSKIHRALKRGVIDAADYAGAAVNRDLGLHRVADYIVMGPASTPSLHQPVDLMEISMSRAVHASLSGPMKALLPGLVRRYSETHHAAMRAAGAEAWREFEASGVRVVRLSEDDARRFRAAAIPLWRKWARADADAARLFAFHLKAMSDPVVGLVTPQDIRDFDLAV